MQRLLSLLSIFIITVTPYFALAESWGFEEKGEGESDSAAPRELEKSPPMSEQEKREMAAQLQALEEKRQREAPQQFAKELELVMQQMMNDPNFFAEALREVKQSPEFKELARLMQAQMQRDLQQIFQLLGGLQNGSGKPDRRKHKPQSPDAFVIDMKELEKLLKEMGIQTK